MNDKKTPKTSEAQRRANAKYDEKNMTRYTVKYNNKLYAKVEQALVDSGINRNAWTVQAIREKLERDGYLSEDDAQENSGK